MAYTHIEKYRDERCAAMGRRKNSTAISRHRIMGPAAVHYILTSYPGLL